MKQKTISFFIVVLLVIFVLAVYLYSLFQDKTMEIIQNKLATFHPYKVNDCEILMKQQNRDYALCTMKEDGTVVLHESTVFSKTNYLGLQVNLQRLDIPFDTYYACAYYDFPLYETQYPQQYGETNAGIYYPVTSCSPQFKTVDYHHWALSGFVLNKSGKYTILRIYIFDGSLPSDFDFKNNLNQGKVAFELNGEVK